MGFDDSSWPQATDLGANGADPWGIQEVSGDARFIWSAELNSASRACCRMQTNHVPINCNAARQRYTMDYIDVHLANQYAYSHFTQQGQAGGRIWHSELCMPDGSDRDASTDENGQIHMAVDNGYTVYVNGQELGSAEDWTTTDTYTFTASCEQPTVYGIDCYDLDDGAVYAAILADISHCGESIMTGTHWKCKSFGGEEPPDGWLNADFNDDDWPAAGDAGDNGVPPWGLRPSISSEAHWIWTHDMVGHNDAYCRFVSHHTVLDCPAAQSRYWNDYPDVAIFEEEELAINPGAGAAPSQGTEAFDHFVTIGEKEGRIWHNGKCMQHFFASASGSLHEAGAQNSATRMARTSTRSARPSTPPTTTSTTSSRSSSALTSPSPSPCAPTTTRTSASSRRKTRVTVRASAGRSTRSC